MTSGEIAYLSLAVGCMVTFIIVLGWVSWDEGLNRNSHKEAGRE